MRLYHVTQTAKVARIMRQGLRRFQTSQWVRGEGGDRYGMGEVYAFSNLTDALRWAGRMDWALHSATGTGKISIIVFDGSEHAWEVDHNDPLSQAGRRGDWLKSEYPVHASKIIEVTAATSDVLRRMHEVGERA